MVMDPAVSQNRETPAFQRDENQNRVMVPRFMHFEPVKYFFGFMHRVVFAFLLHMEADLAARHLLGFSDRADYFFSILLR